MKHIYIAGLILLGSFGVTYASPLIVNYLSSAPSVAQRADLLFRTDADWGFSVYRIVDAGNASTTCYVYANAGEKAGGISCVR